MYMYMYSLHLGFPETRLGYIFISCIVEYLLFHFLNSSVFRLFQIIERIDDTLALLNLVSSSEYGSQMSRMLQFLLSLRKLLRQTFSSFGIISGLYDADYVSPIHSEY